MCSIAHAASLCTGIKFFIVGSSADLEINGRETEGPLVQSQVNHVADVCHTSTAAEAAADRLRLPVGGASRGVNGRGGRTPRQPRGLCGGEEQEERQENGKESLPLRFFSNPSLTKSRQLGPCYTN